jgi:glycerol-3-phosphate dehydrogenase
LSDARELLKLTASHAAEYLDSVPTRSVFPAVEPDGLRKVLGGQLRDGPHDPELVITELAKAADRGIVARSHTRVRCARH